MESLLLFSSSACLCFIKLILTISFRNWLIWHVILPHSVQQVQWAMMVRSWTLHILWCLWLYAFTVNWCCTRDLFCSVPLAGNNHGTGEYNKKHCYKSILLNSRTLAEKCTLPFKGLGFVRIFLMFFRVFHARQSYQLVDQEYRGNKNNK